MFVRQVRNEDRLPSAIAAAALVVGDLVYLHATNGWTKSLGTVGTATVATGVVTRGVDAADILAGVYPEVARKAVIGGYTGLTKGGSVYLCEGATAGTYTQTAPSTVGDVKQIVGYATSTTVIAFSIADDGYAIPDLTSIASDLGTAQSAIDALEALPVVRSAYHSVTRAEVNSGHTMVASPGAGFKLRVTDVKFQSEGDAAATANATHIALNGTQSASAVQIATAAVSDVDNDVVLRLGDAKLAALADGKSFIACDEATALTVAAIGGTDLITFTVLHVVVDYVIEAA